MRPECSYSLSYDGKPEAKMALLCLIEQIDVPKRGDMLVKLRSEAMGPMPEWLGGWRTEGRILEVYSIPTRIETRLWC